MTMRLDVSVGPVQGFVAQSRRTRDLWGSSYLLSFLSAHAIHATRKAGGRIVQPVIDADPLYRWVAGNRTGEPPHVGSAPNHFVAEVDSHAAADAAQAGIDALDAAWKQVCAAVWSRFMDHASTGGNGTVQIWRRQIEGFWETTWTAGDAAADGGLLARRKRWRSHRPPDEPGDKCTVMHDMQELSGYVRAGNRDSRDPQDRFWAGVRRGLGPLELRENERLCAIAFVKRLFPRVAEKALGWPLDTSHWPSTVYMGAVPWIRRAIRVAPESAGRYANTVQDAVGPDVLTEQRPSFANLDTLSGGDFARLDANYLHCDFLQNTALLQADETGGVGGNDAAGRLPEDGTDAPAAAPPGRVTRHGGRGPRPRLDHSLRTLYNATDETGRRLGPPPIFYALLLADGDRLGSLLPRLGRTTVGGALSAFTRRVTGIVSDHDGVVVYAGGDDVMAMLPVPRALACAASLSQAYASAFKDADATAAATLSAAVVFAQIRVPLGAVLAEARRLLDNVAKDANGRDSLAAGVLKPGGLNCQWVTTWVRRDGDHATTAVERIEKLTGRLDPDGAGTGLSSALVYRIRDLLTRLCGWPAWNPGDWGELPADLSANEQRRAARRPGAAPTGTEAFLRAEILQSLSGRSVDAAEASADELTDLVGSLLRRARAPADAGSSAASDQLGVDVLLLARFLAEPGHREAG